MSTSSHTHDRGEREALRKLILSAMFMAIGVILPFFTGQIQQFGKMILPMHLPVMLCGLICGWQYGGAVGLILPFLRSMMFGMPPMYPEAVAMSVELAVYGLTIGLIYSLFKKQNVLTVYLALIPSMILGRAAWGATQVIILGLSDRSFTWGLFFAGAVLRAIPGIIIQLLLIPAIMAMLNHTGMLPYKGEST